jgi:uncharacterized membrane protein YhhN
MDKIFFILMVLFALAEWYAVWKEQYKIRRVTKPGTLVFMILWFTAVTHWEGQLFWFGLALVFSLLGDILLLLPSRFFLGGLSAFFTAHIFYLIAFKLFAPPPNLYRLFLLAVILIFDIFLGRIILKGVRKHTSSKKMLFPVGAYVLVISLMLYTALVTLFRPEWNLNGAILAGLGAVLFVISDSHLGYNKFVKPIKNGNLIVMVTYHLAQFCIILGALQTYLY